MFVRNPLPLIHNQSQCLDLPLVQAKRAQVGHTCLGNQIEDALCRSLKSDLECLSHFLKDRLW